MLCLFLLLFSVSLSQYTRKHLLTLLKPFTDDFPRADIHELIAPDILHQLVKGTFKDHLVDWVCKYLYSEHSKKDTKKILDDIDRRRVQIPVITSQLINCIRIAMAPPFAGLRRFPQGRGFKQWTGDDSKALMKVSQLNL